MKILIVSDRDETKKQVSLHFKPQGSEIMQYWNPIKAMDNLDEIEPDLILFSAQDFPRHWKPMLVFLREHYSREECIFVLLRPDEFAVEEASKAQHLGANGIIGEDVSDPADLARLRELVSRHKAIDDARQSRRLIPGPADRVAYMFSRPSDLRLVTGTVIDISVGGLKFKPHDKSLMQDLKIHHIIRSSSLRIGDTILSLPARIVSVGLAVSVEFLDTGERSLELLSRYIEEHAERELGRASGS